MQAKVYRTCAGTGEKLSFLGTVEFKKEPFSYDTLEQRNNDTEQELLNLHPEMTFDRFEGFGAALTEAAAVSWKKMSGEQQEELIRAFYSAEEGIGYSFGRMAIHSCDFSVSPYSYVEEGDMTLETFDISHEKQAVIPMAKAAAKYAGDLKLFAAPWSPPPYMKDNNSWQGGYLKREYYQLWAGYIRRYVEEMKKAGILLWAVTAQNETRHHQQWESCIYTAEQEAEFVKTALGPAMEGSGVGILVYDHCKERIFERCMAYYSDPVLRNYITGIACH